MDWGLFCYLELRYCDLLHACQTIFNRWQVWCNIVDAIMNGEINLVVNTPIGKRSQHDDSYIRKAAIKYGIPYITTIAAALAAANGIDDYHKGETQVKSLQSYHADIK